MQLATLLRGNKSKKLSSQEGVQHMGYGTFFGVYIPSILSIFGVILYLRMGEIVGNAGILKAMAIIGLSSLITFITGLSISATSTNMRVRSGGAYFMLSRSYGIELGGAIGISLYLAQVFGMAFYIEGFAEAFLSIFPYFSPLGVKIVTLCLVAALTSISSNVALKSQLLIFVLIAVSLLSVGLGAPVLGEAQESAGHTPMSYWALFAIFFPAVTGIEAGFSMSGELKNPSRSLPIGTLGAVVTGLAVYMLIALFLWVRVPRQELLSDPLILMKVARFPALVIVGAWGATLSSAMTSLMGGPRTLQALAYDGVVPKLFAKGYGPHHEPRVAAIFTLALIYLVLSFGSIDVIAPILTMFFLISYGMLNFASGFETLLGNPSWRPTIPIPSYISILGGGLCIVAMLMINSGATFISFFCIVAFYFLVKKQGVSKRLDDIRYGLLTYTVKKAIYRLASMTPSTRSWHPNCVVFASHAAQRGHLTEFASAITRDTGFLTTVSIITSTASSHEKILSLKAATQEFYRKKRIRSLVEVLIDSDLYSGMRRIITAYGMGPITPNTVIMGAVPNANLSDQFIELLKLSHALQKNVVIIKEGTHTYPFPKDGEAHTIDIWWDHKNRKNSHLMVLLAHMLNTSPQWADYNVVIKCLAPNASAKEKMLAYFEEFLTKSRLHIEVKVYVRAEEENSLEAAIQRHSPLAKLLIVGLEPPAAQMEKETYLNTFASLSACVEKLPPNTAFVMHSEPLDLTQIF